MLDAQTKKRIDDLRDILLGKTPSPQSQVEQITTGLIYKFMYDMDKEAKEMGGVPSFFVGEFEKYSWEKLFDPKLTGLEKVNLYSDALEKMYNNPNAPNLFREIFKNTYLPFKDPKILNMFLKEINNFHYLDSEILGDAYEYLISFLGKQGDAGQFRTPRHIIDFIVEIIGPQKNETILDPACGTAGFLISSYKYILKANSRSKTGDQLNAIDRRELSNNLVGYDLDPTFVKISLANLHLHKLTTPKVYEYDTLTSDIRWNEFYDVILANPPFMTPKGGIQPHSRFGVNSKKAEVLFVDYIIEHLKPSGRAGIIVPEGIVFKPYSAYKKLRKKLLDNALVGVISLPPGVFYPYAGVKTSILILDKSLNKKNNNIFFAYVNNDGFSLSQQRIKISENDLPKIKELIKKQKSDESLNFISKAQILSEKDLSLQINRYVEVEKLKTRHQVVPITDTFDVITPPKKIKSKEFLKSGKYPIIDQSSKKVSGFWDENSDHIKVNKPLVIFGDHTRIVKYVDFDFVAGADGIKILMPKKNINPKFLFYILQSIDLPNLGYSRHFKELKNQEIPLPSLEYQENFLEEIEIYQKIVDGCNLIIDNYKPTITFDPSWEKIRLGEMATTEYGTGKKSKKSGKFIVLRMGNLQKGEIDFSDLVYSDDEHDLQKLELVSGDILFNRTNSPELVGKTSIFRGYSTPTLFAGYLVRVKVNRKKLLPEYLNAVLNSYYGQNLNHQNVSVSGNQANISASKLSNYLIPTPTLEIQKEIVDSLDIEYQTVIGNKRLGNIYKDKIIQKVCNIWEEV